MIKQFVNFDLKAHSASQGIIEGYGSIFGNVDRGGDEIQRGAFSESIAAHKAAGTRPAFFSGHDRSLPVGEWTEFYEDSKGLFLKGQLWIEDGNGKFATAEARQTFNMLSSKGSQGLSIGYRIDKDGAESVMRKDSNGDDIRVTLLKKLHLFEVSAVSIPMNQAAQVTSIKNMPDAQWSARDLEKGLRQLGLSKRQAQCLLSKGMSGLSDSSADELSDSEAEAKAFMEAFTKKSKELRNV